MKHTLKTNIALAVFLAAIPSLPLFAVMESAHAADVPKASVMSSFSHDVVDRSTASGTNADARDPIDGTFESGFLVKGDGKTGPTVQLRELTKNIQIHSPIWHDFSCRS